MPNIVPKIRPIAQPKKEILSVKSVPRHNAGSDLTIRLKSIIIVSTSSF